VSLIERSGHDIHRCETLATARPTWFIIRHPVSQGLLLPVEADRGIRRGEFVPPQSKTSFLMATACAGLFTFGIMTSFLGTTMQEWAIRLGFDLVRGGALFSFCIFPNTWVWRA
jgi:hypothetical protein